MTVHVTPDDHTPTATATQRSQPFSRVATATVMLGLTVAVVRSPDLTLGQRALLVVLLSSASLLTHLGIRHAQRLESQRRARAWHLTVILAGLGAIGTAVAVTGLWQSPFLPMLVLPVVLAGTLLDQRAAWAVLALTLLTPVVAHAVTGDPRTLIAIPLTLAVGVTGIVCLRTSHRLRQLAHDERVAKLDAERHAQLLDTVVGAAESVIGQDMDTGVRELLRATIVCGFTGAWLTEVDGRGTTQRVVGQLGVDVGSDPVLRTETTLSEQALRDDRTVVVTDYATHPGAHPAVVAAGAVTVMATPVRVEGETIGVLAAGSRRRLEFADAERGALEMLAVHAGLLVQKGRRAQRQESVRRDREAQLERRRDHLATVAHELRTPLTVVQGLSAMLTRRWDELPEPRRRELLARIAQRADLLGPLLERLAQLDELHRADLMLAPVTVDVVKTAHDALRRMMLEERGYRVTLRAPSTLRLEADPLLLSVLLEELFSNVAAHTPTGTEVEVSLVAEDGTTTIRVVDDGPGLDPRLRDEVTDPFSRGGGRTERPGGGLGIGLTLVRRVVELHKGTLRLESSRDGTTVQVALPVTQERPAPWSLADGELHVVLLDDRGDAVPLGRVPEAS